MPCCTRDTASIASSNTFPASASTFVRWSQNSLPSAATAALSPVATEWSRRFQIATCQSAPKNLAHARTDAWSSLRNNVDALLFMYRPSRGAAEDAAPDEETQQPVECVGVDVQRRGELRGAAPRAPERIGHAEIRRDGERLGVDDAEAALEQRHLGWDHPAVHASDPVANRQQRAYHPCGRHAGVGHRMTVYPRRSTIIAMP